MDKHHSEMQEASEKMSYQCTTVQKNCGMPIKKRVNLFQKEKTRKMEPALKKVADKQSAKKVRSPSSGENSPESRYVNKWIPQNNLGNAGDIA